MKTCIPLIEKINIWSNVYNHSPTDWCNVERNFKEITESPMLPFLWINFSEKKNSIQIFIKIVSVNVYPVYKIALTHDSFNALELIDWGSHWRVLLYSAQIYTNSSPSPIYCIVYYLSIFQHAWLTLQRSLTKRFFKVCSIRLANLSLSFLLKPPPCTS